MSRRRLDPDSNTRPLTIKLSEVLLADMRAATTRTGQSLGEYVREALELAIARGRDAMSTTTKEQTMTAADQIAELAYRLMCGTAGPLPVDLSAADVQTCRDALHSTDTAGGLTIESALALPAMQRALVAPTR